jgi:hypothetical protein
MIKNINKLPTQMQAQTAQNSKLMNLMKNRIQDQKEDKQIR